jgi:aspartate-semialdehyde dehydrogenase
MSDGLDVAVVGATGLVGETLVQVLEERTFPVARLHLLAEPRGLGRRVEFRGASAPVGALAEFDFARVKLAFFAASATTAREHAPRAAAAGALVIDLSSAFRDDPQVPLVVPEVNSHALSRTPARGIIANPLSGAIQLAVALKPLHQQVGIERINVCTYQAVSGAGRAALEELASQSAALLSGRGPVEAHVLPKQIAFNCLPQVDEFEDNGYTREELKLHRELKRLLEDEALAVNATAVRVPVFYGNSQAVHLTTRTRITVADVRTLYESASGVTVLDELRPGGYPTAATEAANRDTVYVGRIREDMSYERGLNLWIVADNVRKGGATNAVQIAESWIRDFM